MERFLKLVFMTLLTLLFAVVDAACATWILDWMHISFAHWFQIALVVSATIGSALMLHEIRKD